MQRFAGPFACLILLAAIVSPAPLRAQSDDGISIMRPEPFGRAPAYRSPPELNRMQPTPRIQQPAPSRAAPPPPIYVPETGRLVPNQRTLSPSGPNGIETGQDRAMRCAHQLGASGADAGNPSAYLGSCVTQ